MHAYRLGVSLVGMTGPGSGAWTRLAGLLPALLATTGGPSPTLIVDRPDVAAAVGALIPTGSGAEVVSVRPLSRAERLTGLRRVLSDAVAACELDLLALEAPPVPAGLPVPAVLTLHDLRAYHGVPVRRMPTAEELNMRLLLPRQARRAAAVVAVSTWTAADVVARLGVAADRVHVVPNPVVGPATPTDGGESDASERTHVLALGHLERRKNLGVLVAASRRPEWPVDVRLILAGADHGQRAGLARDADPDRLVVPGAVAPAERERLLRGALAVAVPSLVEGFGYAAVEGIAAGAPALVADRAALPETVGTPEACLPPDDPAAWAVAVARLASDPAHRSRLLAAQRAGLARFDPAAVAARLVEVHRRVLDEHRR